MVVQVHSFLATAVGGGECVSLALVIQHAMRMSRIVICGPARLCRIFRRYLINGTKTVVEHEMCFDIYCDFCLKLFVVLRRSRPGAALSLYISSLLVCV